ncbi:hypothetical protein [Burkholderia perseverans]|uniref:hypothetical protein n=1 Tax=Burkholderia perseverans TaxID=2615214 RepID=UPI001FEDF54C|nr:hypothetical protein [Burkholderia perseverans]
MTLLEATPWLSPDVTGFADLDAFAERCRRAAARADHEAAALALIAQAAAAFTGRHEGTALPAGAMRTVLAALHEQARRLADAGARGSNALLAALDCAAHPADEAGSDAVFRPSAPPRS